MSLPLISFFLSLVGIIGMLGCKIMHLKNGKVIYTENLEHSHPLAPDFQKIKHLTRRGFKKFGYVALFVILKFFIKFSNFIKIKSQILVQEIKDKFRKKNSDLSGETMGKKEVSKYLKVISEYRQKIRKMRHLIKEEEGIK